MELIIILSLIATFVLSVGAIAYLELRPRRVVLERLQELPAPAAQSGGPSMAAGPPPVVDPKVLRAIRKSAPRTPITAGGASGAQKKLIHAGFRSSSALVSFNMVRLITTVGPPSLYWIFTYHTHLPPGLRLLVACFLLLIGYAAPWLALQSLARRRQHRLRLSLPDALDLLVICVEAGMGLNQALVKVSDELEQTHPEISEELKLVNLEIRAGRTRPEALRNLGERTGVDDIISLAATLIQTDKFGTSIARSLRVHSESLRTERMQRAEEAAAKTTIKLIFPLLLCIFPALLVVVLGPAFLNLAHILGDVVSSTAK